MYCILERELGWKIALCEELVCKPMSTGKLDEKDSRESGGYLPDKLCSERCVDWCEEKKSSRGNSLHFITRYQGTRLLWRSMFHSQWSRGQ